MTRRTGPRCHPMCRDRRPPAPGVAARVAAFLDRKGVDPSQMSAYLADFGVERFADLCYSHADSIDVGLRKSILLDDVRAYPNTNR